MDEKQSNCDVCLENEFRNCKLPCDHVCCIKCIKESIKINEEGSYECPSCFESFKAPSDEFESWIQKEQEDTRQTEIAGLTKTSKSKECDICMQKKVTTFCGDCNHYYCLKCSLTHSKIPSTRLHLVEKVLLKDEDKGDANEVVEEAENVNVYCDDCKEVVSLRVYASQHKKHKMRLMTDFMKWNKIEMDKEIAITRCKFSEIEAELHKIALKLLKCENVTNEVKMLIDERTKLLKHVIDSQAKKICKEVDKKAYSYVKKAVASKLQLNNLKQALEKKITKCENAANILTTDDRNDTLFGSWPISDVLEEFVLSFKWNSDKDEAKIMEIFGSLMFYNDFSFDAKSFPKSIPKFSFGMPSGNAIEKGFLDSTSKFSFGMPSGNATEKELSIESSKGTVTEKSLPVSTQGMSNLFDWREKCSNFRLVGAG